jgi:hypothetical protein
VYHLERFADRFGRQTATSIIGGEVVSLLNEHIERPTFPGAG